MNIKTKRLIQEQLDKFPEIVNIYLSGDLFDLSTNPMILFSIDESVCKDRYYDIIASIDSDIDARCSSKDSETIVITIVCYASSGDNIGNGTPGMIKIYADGRFLE